ncbi:MAG: type II secretion system F family protein [Defluviitaleaceae bacterium]|nr:type II secretion system F family protein [Defluviitaleaceae bacterium]MCL2276251.1 type II secretion system F family protein [Defluviitaleaceae bacterium]
MLASQTARAKNDAPSLSIWHRNVGDIFAHGGAKIPARELAVFNKQLAFLLAAGVTIKEALPIIQTQIKGRQLSQAMPNLHKSVMQGESFSAALKAAGCFPVFMHSFVVIGEKTARLPQVCAQLADYYEGQAQTESELIAALIYPAAVTAMMLSVIVMAIVFVLPGYAEVFANTGVALPALTRGLLAVSAFLTGNAAWLGLGLLVCIASFIYVARTEQGSLLFSALQLRFGLYRQRVNLRLVQSVALMLDAGQSVSNAIPLCGDVAGNKRVKQDMQYIHAELTAGRAFWTSIANLPYIDPLLIGLARVGEEAGALSQTMAQCSNYFMQNYRHSMKQANKLVEPIITLVLGILLALVMLAIVLPTFEMATAV